MSSLEEDYKDVNKMVLAAKDGKWNDVYTILTKKPYLVNMIPEERSWAALHQAVWWNSESAVRWLLFQCKSCDPLVMTKQNPDHGAGLTPADIASDPSRPRPDIKTILNNFTDKQRQDRFGTDAPYFISVIDGERMDRKGLPLLLLALTNYKKTFHSSKVDPHEPFHDIMNEIAAFEHNGSHWKHAREKIADSMRGFCMKKSIDLISTSGEDENAFYASVVKLYTDSVGFYSYVNRALRQESNSTDIKDYKPTGDELAIAPYALMLDTILFCWTSLESFAGFSYRGIGMSRDYTVSKYSKGLGFVWLQFVSSSKLERIGRNFGKSGAKNGHYALFKIDNATNCYWQPRDISKYSQFKPEQEVLYPAGAEFIVDRVDSEVSDGSCKYTTVHLKLVDPLG